MFSLDPTAWNLSWLRWTADQARKRKSVIDDFLRSEEWRVGRDMLMAAAQLVSAIVVEAIRRVVAGAMAAPNAHIDQVASQAAVGTKLEAVKAELGEVMPEGYNSYRSRRNRRYSALPEGYKPGGLAVGMALEEDAPKAADKPSEVKAEPGLDIDEDTRDRKAVEALIYAPAFGR